MYIHKGPLVCVLRHVMSHLYWPPSHVMTSQGLLTNTRYLLSDSSDDERLIRLSLLLLLNSDEYKKKIETATLIVT